MKKFEQLGFQNINAGGFAPPQGMFDPALEKDACGTGFIARLDCKPEHAMVRSAVDMLCNLEHRGAVGGDKLTGDGAGLLMDIPDGFLRRQIKNDGGDLPPQGDYGLASLFLPTDDALAERSRELITRVLRDEGMEPLHWRQVPVDAGGLGKLSLDSMPRFEQLFIDRCEVPRGGNLERKLYVARRIIEKEIQDWNDDDFSQFYVCSMSARTVVYKGMLTGTQLITFYKDFKDPSFAISFALVHQRFSTNTLPTWSLAQPFRNLAHNGEINTLRGNINQFRAREANFSSALFGQDLDKIKPVLVESGSDSAVFDNAYELLVMAGREAPHAMMMMIPEAFGKRFHMSEDKRAFYEYHAAILAPWDGPASIAFTDGDRYIGAVLDRNGLRPSRYWVTDDGHVIMASETGVLDIPEDQVIKKGRLQPGKMFLVDREQRRIVPDSEIKSRVTRSKPYRHWLAQHRIELRGLHAPSQLPPEDPDKVLRMQHAFGYTEEDLKIILAPMANNGQEPTGSMGNDSALAVLSERSQLLYNYFKQLFAQVTNPPIDPLREELVMSLMSFMGREGNLLDETPEGIERLKLQHPILTPMDLMRLYASDHPQLKVQDIEMLFPVGGDGQALEKALDDIFAAAERAIAEGATILVLSDRNFSAERMPIPALLAASGLHHHLIRRGLRTHVSLAVDSAEPREVMHFAQLIGYGVHAICPYGAIATIQKLAREGLLEKQDTPEEAVDRYIIAIMKGLLKTFSRMGISTVRSFQGAQIFEAVGLETAMVDRYFTNTASRVSGAGLDEIAKEALLRFRRGFPEDENEEINDILDAGGAYAIRNKGEHHMWTPKAIHHLQHATRSNDYEEFKQYSRSLDGETRKHAVLRSLLRFRGGKSIPLEEVEPVEAITPRFVTAAMSYGSISKEAHEAIAIAMNRIGGRSNSGEGGEDPARYEPLPNGDSKISRIKQVASGRFGVTIDYMVHCDELQIKIAQGAKPGEGGQLPGYKVNEEIARVRHTTPGVTLISPPPHHDIYSIEDLAQLIHDLKCANPTGKVSVKLVSEVGVGTIAAGVAKAKADLVLISGHDGGTGASPQTSIKFAGLPWELGLSETQQALVNNHLRDKIVVQVDGHLKTGRDLAIAALMGAEEFGFGTSTLITQGCIMMRKCHLNTCPVGVATQDPRLRKLYTGDPEYTVRFLRFVAQELREYMAMLGFRTVNEMVGQVQHLEPAPEIKQLWKGHALDFSSVLHKPELPEGLTRHCTKEQDHALDQSLDQELIRLARPTLENREPVTIDLPVRNIHRTVGTILSSEVAKRFGGTTLEDDTIQINLRGSAGQSLGAYMAKGITIRVEGDVNDYLGKGLSGGKLIVVPPRESRFVPHENIIAGNVILYGATEGEVYLQGMAGERFCVRNSGARAVVEGVGDHGCEYMTGGRVVIIGPTGYNFAAGMSGGIAYVYDETEMFETRCNLSMVDLETVWQQSDLAELRGMLENHYRYTKSSRAKWLLDNWETHYPRFVKVMPVEYRKVLERMRMNEETHQDTVSATEEVYSG